MRFGSLFSGIGGIDLGLERAGMTPAWQCEIEPLPQRVLRTHWPEVPVYDDVRTLDPGQLEPVVLLAGGFPCQDISVAGRRAGLAGERSRLFHEFMRLAAGLRPKWLLLENVPGLLSSNRGRDMGTVLGKLGELGYGYAYRVLDAQYFGVAQRRRRVFIVGCLGDGASAAAVLFEPESCVGGAAPFGAEGQGVAATLTGGSATGGGVNAPGRRREDDVNLVVARTVTTREGRRHDASLETFVIQDVRVGTRDKTNQGQGIGIRQGGPMYTLSVTERHAVFAFTERTRADGRNFECSEELAYCLTNPGSGGRTHSRQIGGPFDVRRLTPLECERLQGFPDNWTRMDDKTSDSPRYRACGNAVCVPVAEWIGRRIAEVDQQLREEAS